MPSTRSRIEVTCSRRAVIKSKNRELTNRRLSYDAAAGSRHSSALPSCFEFTIRGKDDDVGACGSKFSRRF